MTAFRHCGLLLSIAASTKAKYPQVTKKWREAAGMQLQRVSRLFWPPQLTLRSHTLKGRDNEHHSQLDWAPRPSTSLKTSSPSCECSSLYSITTNAAATFGELSVFETTWTSRVSETTGLGVTRPSRACITWNSQHVTTMNQSLWVLQRGGWADTAWGPLIFWVTCQSYPLSVPRYQTVPLKRSRLCDPKITGPCCCYSLGCVLESEVMYFLWNCSDILIMQEKGQFESYDAGLLGKR